MATTSEVKAGLDSIAESIASVRSRFAASKVAIQNNSGTLGSIPTKWADVIATIDGYAGSDPFEALAQDEKAKLATEFSALKAEIDAVVGGF